jgi:hypothetical protein
MNNRVTAPPITPAERAKCYRAGAEQALATAAHYRLMQDDFPNDAVHYQNEEARAIARAAHYERIAASLDATAGSIPDA